MDFSNFTELEVNAQKTADYTFHELPGAPVLRSRYAGESNKPFFNELLRRAEHRQKRKQKLNVEVVRDNRARDAELYAKHIVASWPTPPRDKSGVEAPFSKENVEAWLRAIPVASFDAYREFCQDVGNFMDELDAEAAAGNSPTG